MSEIFVKHPFSFMSYSCMFPFDRMLYEQHAVMLGDMFDILHALQMALLTEDFGPTHATCMESIGDVCHQQN